MAKKSNLPYVVNGYAQVEANRLTYMVNGEMESQAPAVDYTTGNPIPMLENGMFLILSAVTALTPAAAAAACPFGRMAILPGEGDAADEAWMVYSEKKIYDERGGYVDWAALSSESVDTWIYPRLVKIHPGDAYTTNCINELAVALNDILYVGDDGYLTKTAGKNTSLCFKVTKVYTMPNGDPGVQLVAENYR